MLTVLAMLATLLAAVAPLSAQEDVVDREYLIKAAYLYNLGRYVEWPKETFADARAPLVIGVLEPDPFGEDLDTIARYKDLNGRAIQVRRFARAEDVVACHILYFPRVTAIATQEAIIRRLAGRHVLYVGESETFLAHGGVVNFVIVENKVRLVVALPAARRESLQFSSKLLQLAQVVN